MPNIAVILAGGSGNRLGNTTPKQFLQVAGKQVIEYTIDTFENCRLIDEICIVSRQDYIPEVETIVRRNNYRKVKKILQGGAERYHSTIAAINAYTDDSINLIFHDAARPLLKESIIRSCVSALQYYNCVTVAAMTTDTILVIDNQGCVSAIPNRDSLRNVQTPQCFKRSTIKQAYDFALQDPDFTTTDDCGTVLRYLPNEKIFVVNGDNTNIKLTYPEDISIIENLILHRN